MATETERKFLLRNDSWRADADAGAAIMQGYLANTHDCTVRVRVQGDSAWLTVKGPSETISRAEFEYPVPVADATEMLDSLAARPFIEKLRYRVVVAEHCWEIDVFGGDNLGLVVAEIELTSAEETFVRPDWVGREVSDDARYFNAALVKRPFLTW
jgi:adenylate cyclase